LLEVLWHSPGANDIITQSLVQLAQGCIAVAGIGNDSGGGLSSAVGCSGRWWRGDLNGRRGCFAVTAAATRQDHCHASDGQAIRRSTYPSTHHGRIREMSPKGMTLKLTTSH